MAMTRDEQDTLSDLNLSKQRTKGVKQTDSLAVSTTDTDNSAGDPPTKRRRTFKTTDSVNSTNTSSSSTDNEDTQSPSPKETSAADKARANKLELDKISMAIDGARRQAQEDTAAQITAYEEEIDELRKKAATTSERLDQKDQELAAAQDQAESDINLLVSQFYRGLPVTALDRSGSASPATSPHRTGSRSIGRYHNHDLLSEYKRIIEKDCVATTAYAPSGMIVDQRDYRQADLFYQQHKESLLFAVQDEMKDAGFLRGGVSSRGRDATSPADLPHAFLDVVSSAGRMTHLSSAIYWQFVRRITDTSINCEQTGRFPRYEYGASSDNISDYLLGSAVGSLQTTADSIRSNTVSIEVQEYGIGRPGTSLKPVAVHEIITANNALDAFEAVNRNLVRSYNLFEDLAIRSLLHSTTRVLYNSNNTVVTDVGDVAGGGQITQKYLTSLHAYMSDNDIPSFSDGSYTLIMPPLSISALKQDVIDRTRVTEAPNFEALTELLNEYHGNANLGRISGYIGKIGGFNVFQAGTHGKGNAPGEGVQAETLNGTAVTTRSCYAFGVDPVGVIDAMPFTVRQKSDTSYGRETDFIWLSHQGFGALDIDPLRPNGSSSEQLRVVEIRSADIGV